MSQMEPGQRNLPKCQGDVTAPRSKPHSQWTCGYAELGKCCGSGPTADGRCGRLVNSAGDSTPDAEPCIPRRGHRWRRDALKVNLAIMAAGLLLLCMSLPTREALFVPGELSSKHAQILNNTLVSQRCSVCHPTVHDGKVQLEAQPDTKSNWFVGAALQTAHGLVENDGRQDKLCMQCHQSHMPAASLRLAHDLSPEMWAQLRASEPKPAWQLVSTATADSDVDLARGDSSVVAATSCAVCHVEHQGRQFDLKQISDSRCQACHKRQFESLASGHPEFVNFPADRPRRLMFSHARHQGEHFSKKGKDFDCKSCHIDSSKGGAYGVVTRSLTFESACASCHDAPIRAATTEGWALLQLPALEAAAISGNSDLANWPQSARYGYDGEVSPVLRALLLADEGLATEIQSLPISGKIVDISTIADGRARVATRVALATKQLIDDTAREGQVAWMRRLEQVTKRYVARELSEDEKSLIARMCAGLPPDLFRQLQRDWFVSSPAVANSSSPVLRLTSSLPMPVQQLSTKDRQDAEDNDLLDGDSLGSDSSDGDLIPAQDQDDLLLGIPDNEDARSQVRSSESTNKVPAIKGATHLTSGGWYVDPTTLSVRYLPTGHADGLQAAWAEWWNFIENQRRPEAPPHWLASEFVSQASRVPGGCVQCHQLPAEQVNVSAYRIYERSRAEKEFTKFNHTPHLSLPAVRDCKFCHDLKPASVPAPAPAGGDKLVSLKPLAIHPQTDSEFSSIQLHQCASCHRPGGATDGCLQCHNYHISTINP